MGDLDLQRRCVNLPNWQWELLTAVGGQAGKSNSELLRICLDHFLDTKNLNKLFPVLSGRIAS